MKRMVPALMAVVLVLGTPRAAFAAAEGYMVSKDGERYPGKFVWKGSEEFFVYCPSGRSFSLTKYPVRVVDAPDGACPHSLSLNDARSDVLADCSESANPEQCERDKAAAEAKAERVRKAEREKIRRMLEAYGYDVDETDIQ
ncbi:MAG: hypothetical protein ABR923_20435 [Terracidiphilus sp.]